MKLTELFERNKKGHEIIRCHCGKEFRIEQLEKLRTHAYCEHNTHIDFTEIKVTKLRLIKGKNESLL